MSGIKLQMSATKRCEHRRHFYLVNTRRVIDEILSTGRYVTWSSTLQGITCQKIIAVIELSGVTLSKNTFNTRESNITECTRERMLYNACYM